MKRGMMKMSETDLRDACRGHDSVTGAARGDHRNSRCVSTRSILPRLVQLGLLSLLMLTLNAGLCAADESDGAVAPATPGIKASQDPEAYMRELAARMGSTEGKDLLLRGTGTNTKQPRATAPAAPVKKPAAAQPAPTKPAPAPARPVASPSRPIELSLPQSQPGASTLTQPVWSRPLATDSSAQELKLFEPGTAPPAEAAPSNVIVVRDPSAEPLPEPNTAALQRPPLDAATWLSIYNKAAERGLQDMQAERRAQANKPWTLGSDLDKYRAHAVKDGSRESGESLMKALERSGMAVGDGVNVFLLGYASDRAQAFRANDGKGLLDEPGKVPQQAGATLGSAADGLYSLADLLTLNALPDTNKPAYRDNVPIVRPIIFAGRTVGGVWKTTEEIGNAVTWGFFDNVTGCLGLLIEDVIEVLKHTGEAVTNVARLPLRALGAKDENAEKAMDWALLVPLELVSNSVEMKGIANTIDYKTAFADKGVIGSIVEFGGSSFVLYRAIDESVDRMKDDHHKHHSDSGNNNNGGNNGGGGGNNGGGVNPPPVGPDDAVVWIGDLWPWWPPD